MAGATSSCLRGASDGPTSNIPADDERLIISEISDFLCLSGCSHLRADRLEELGITAAVNSIKGIHPRLPPNIQVLYIPVEDDEGESLREYFAQVRDFIQREKEKGGRTLVFCGLGISRSATFIINYYMHCEGMALIDAYKYVQSRRSIICPNVGFFRQLLEDEQKLYGKQTVKIIEPTPGVLVPDVIWDEVYQEVMIKLGKI